MTDFKYFIHTPQELPDSSIDYLAKRLSNCFGVSPTIANRVLHSSGYIVWMNKGNSEPLSFCTVEVVSNYGGGSVNKIYNVCTPEQYRQKGYASKLIQYIISIKRTNESIWLSIDSKSVVGLYTKLGFCKPNIISRDAQGNYKNLTVELVYRDDATNEMKKTAKEEATKYLDEIQNINKNKKSITLPFDRAILFDMYRNRLVDPKYEYGGMVYMNNGKLYLGNINRGSVASVNVPCEYNWSFHTHPLSAYDKSDIGVNPISHTDLLRELVCGSSFGIVIALEGIYTYQINPEIHRLIKFWSSIHSNLLFDLFRDQVELCLNKAVNKAYPKYNYLRTIFNQSISTNENLLEFVNSSQYMTQAHKYIFELIDDYSSVRIKDVTKNSSVLLKKSLATIDSNTHIYNINFVPNVYGLLKANKPVCIKIIF